MGKLLRFVLVFLLPAFLVLCCSLFSKTRVTFEVTGSATSADLVYQYGARMASPANVPLPWSFSYDGSKGDWCDLFAISNSGTLTVTLYKDGSLWVTATNAPGGTYAGYNYAEAYGGL